ncbi:MAG: SMI1/KNR4 family protein [Myxococcales bacterium]|nr:SMI1/KNR4 family protein [Myxococcales bacterium]
MSLPVILQSCAARSGAVAGALRDAEQQLGRALPDDYKALLQESDGLEGFISADAFVSLWAAADLASLNDAYAVAEFVPDVTLLGTDGGGTGYGYRNVGGQIEYVALPLVGMETGAITVIGRTFMELLERLAR